MSNELEIRSAEAIWLDREYVSITFNVRADLVFDRLGQLDNEYIRAELVHAFSRASLDALANAAPPGDQ